VSFGSALRAFRLGCRSTTETLEREIERIAADTQFSGAVRVGRGDQVELAKAYGMARRGLQIANTVAATRGHQVERYVDWMTAFGTTSAAGAATSFTRARAGMVFKVRRDLSMVSYMPASQPSDRDIPGARTADGIRDRRLARFADELGDALAEGETAAAEDVLRRALHDGMPAPAILSRVIGPAMYEIGRRWERCAISVADEHLATAACHQLLAVVYEHLLVARARTRSRVLLAGMENEQHSLGLRMAADVLEGAGYDVIYLGSDVPRDALLDSVSRFQPGLVGLTATMPETAVAVAALIPDLRAIDSELAVLVGGQGLAPNWLASRGSRSTMMWKDWRKPRNDWHRRTVLRLSTASSVQ
jgi:methanogenic corrinoid protein MtbC1